MSNISHAQCTVSNRATRRRVAVPRQVAWEKVLNRLRMKLSGRPSRSAVFGRAGLPEGKGYWMRRQPDLRISVLVKLAKALEVRPGLFLEMLLRETNTDQSGNIKF